MPTVRIYDNPCRVRLLLDAIGAQEALEEFGRRRLALACPSPGRAHAFEREHLQVARRRNAAERRLREGEHYAWERWRQAGPAEREVVRAMLTDLPTKEDR